MNSWRLREHIVERRDVCYQGLLIWFGGINICAGYKKANVSHFRFSLQPDTNVRYLQDAGIESIITTTTDGATLRCTNRGRKRFWSGNRDQKERAPR
ncbi:hypothetical protein PUN28_003172 [Cardiocondyla obscurior]|uniref:Uncharacterized protein n=1 Tax=Cardiocondyla obscurior TaxID=286306 RepID=A0AAW2GKI5_9HYME